MAKQDSREPKRVASGTRVSSPEDSDSVARNSSTKEDGGQGIWAKGKMWAKSNFGRTGDPLDRDASVSARRREKQIGDVPNIISERLRAFGRRVGMSDSELARMAKRPRSELRDLFAKHGISPGEAKALLDDLGRVGEDLVERAKEAIAEKASKARTVLEKAQANLDKLKDLISDKGTPQGSTSDAPQPPEPPTTGSHKAPTEDSRRPGGTSLVPGCFGQWWEWIVSLPSRWWHWLMESLQYLGEKLKRLLIILLWLLLIVCLCAVAVWLLPHLLAVISPDLLPWIGLVAVVAVLILAVLFLGWETIRRWLSRLTGFLLSVLTGRFLLKLLAYLLAMALFALSASVLYYRYDAKMVNQLKALTRVDPLPVAKALVADGKYCDALEYLEFFREYDYVRNNPEITSFYDQVRLERDSWWFSVKDAIEGVWSGKGACYESLAAATVSDFFIIGDLRDLILEGTNWYNGQETDEFVVALAAAGVVLSAPTYAGGAGAPAKGSLSLLKVAKRLERISVPLQKELIKIFRETARLRSIEPIKPLAGHLSSLKDLSHLSTRDFLEMLSKCSSVSDLKVMREAAVAYGTKTGKVLKLGGEAPLQTLKKFGGDAHLSKAVDQSLQYGRKGTQVLGELGPTRFLRLLTLAKYGVRAGRSLWQHRLTLVAAWLLSLLPEWAIWTAAILSGLVVIGWPALGITRLVWTCVQHK